ncbi:uncharacterized protein F5891DRAFT_301885 [Suillus fuscotomentosus]|uniref:General stress protein FMN-binding split barrel domain-containing protein n=1 Tax=Suillus fuscotomentosus TaxID=1912939 RepID=A0AAD4HK56_9AGAM|nr:uncharacterized protein F5891DRAFT_301885 [Suillus fuscotomentosus]KAG1900630.1 hypothetical protein F5891DRAFT_301885 [Suillus fuscotomentosus]
MSDLSPEQARLDPYSSLAESTNVTLQEKITGLHTVIQKAKVGMLVTRDVNGNLHSRAMTPTKPLSDTQLTLVFLANNASHKFGDIENDAHVNVSFCDASSTDWASYSGRARVTEDQELINKLWSPILTGYFGDLKDGVHKGDKTDPRVAVIEVVPDEIKYWITNHSSAVRTTEVAYAAATGKATAPGQSRIISKEEVQLSQGL